MEILSSPCWWLQGTNEAGAVVQHHYGRLAGFTKPLLDKGLLSSKSTEGQEVFSTTEDGYRTYRDWLEVWRRLPLG